MLNLLSQLRAKGVSCIFVIADPEGCRYSPCLLEGVTLPALTCLNKSMVKDLHLENIRREYSSLSLGRKDLPDDPFVLVERWLQQAIETQVNEPTPDGYPSVRTVLLKEVLDEQFVFYSNYESRKGRQIASNPHVALTFLWHELERQIHVEGDIHRLSPEESDAYFAMRPYKSRVGAADTLAGIYHDALRLGESPLRGAGGTSSRVLGGLRRRPSAHRVLAGA